MKKIKALLRKRLENNKKNQKGFSLVELIIVIAILGIISTIAIPNIMGALDDARKKSDIANGAVIANAIMMARAKDETVAPKAASDKETVSLDNNKILAEINGTTLPKVKYNQDAEGTKKFTATVDTTGSIAVSAGGVQVYPTPEGAYAN